MEKKDGLKQKQEAAVWHRKEGEMDGKIKGRKRREQQNSRT